MGPMLAAAYHEMAVCLEKLSSTRYEREIASGGLSRGDVTPGVPNLPGPANVVSRKMTRDQLRAPAEVGPGALERTRVLNDKLYRTQVPQAGQYVPGLYGSTAISPGNVAGFLGTNGVKVPEESGQFMRGLGGSTVDRLKGTVGAMSSAKGDPTLLRQLLPERAPVDRTLNYAAGQHEIGEGAEFARGVFRPNASHLGVEPILRENIAIKGDPEAVRAMSNLRSVHPDDRLVQKAIRQVGGTPDAPLALGGRQQRAVERIVDRNASQLASASRMKAVQLKDFGQTPYVPEHIPTLSKVIGKAQEAGKSPSLMGRLRGFKDVLTDASAIRKFTK